jgi:predicted  nucleic acid-binding Zn-ribbon protein
MDGDRLIRDIPLKPGLNVIWSPDSAGEAERIGHGGGKTTLCRLIRYCLGEKNYGPPGQVEAVGSKFLNGRVLAEVRLDGVTWLINRPLGVTRGDFAVTGENAIAFQWPKDPTGMQIFRDAATVAFLGASSSLLPSSIPPGERWLAVLAWLTRDQECRFSHLLDWRSPDSGSQSPISGRNKSQDDRLATLRIALGMLGPEEIEATLRRNEIASQLAGNRSELTKVTWHIARLKRGVLSLLGEESQDDVSRLQLSELDRRTSEHMAKVRSEDDGRTVTLLQEARTAFQSAAIELGKLEGKANGLESDISFRELQAKTAQDEIPGLVARKLRGSSELCPICEVPIDQVLAEGCGISLTPCNLEEVSARLDDARTRGQSALVEVASLRNQKDRLKYQIASAIQALDRSRELHERVAVEAGQRSNLLRLAERAADLVHDLKEEMDEADRLNDKIASLVRDQDDLATSLAEYRLQVAKVVQMVSDRFSAIFSQMVKTNGRSSVRLDGNGLQVKASADGTAITSFAVVLFDLAALTLAMEGKTRHPDFLLHDSPREADLGGSLYSEIFRFAQSLEEVGSAPLFQYVITTTTEPPEQFRQKPWLRLQLQGAPETDRLFRVNL